jgi:hypothetical protein
MFRELGALKRQLKNLRGNSLDEHDCAPVAFRRERNFSLSHRRLGQEPLPVMDIEQPSLSGPGRMLVESWW